MKKNPTLKLCAAAALVAFAALSVDAAGAADEIKALRGIIESNSVDRTTKCRYYKAWYAEQCTKAELVAMLERNIAFKKEIVEQLAVAEAQLFDPLKELLNSALTKIAIENGYAFILNTDGDALPYVDSTQGEDVTEYVKREFSN
jgi:hypothetical protein